MTTVSLPTVPENQPTNLQPNHANLRVYDIKIDYDVKELEGTIPGAAILTSVLTTLENTTNDTNTMIIQDIYGSPTNATLWNIPDKELGTRFCMESAGKDNNRFMAGFKIQTDMTYKEIKARTTDTFKEMKVNFRLHREGFEYGVNWISIGFLMQYHHIFADCTTMTATLRNEICSAWYEDQEYWINNKLQEPILTKLQVDADKIQASNIPIIILPNPIGIKNQDTSVWTTSKALTIMTPFKTMSACRHFMDYFAVYKETHKNYIASALKTKEPQEYKALVKQHDNWLNNHRNIQINNVPSMEAFISIRSPTSQDTLYQKLSTTPHVLNAMYYDKGQRVNVSVMLQHFAETRDLLHHTVTSAKYEYSPTVKNTYPPQTGDSDDSTKTSKSKYASILAHHKALRSRNKTQSSNSTASSKQTPWRTKFTQRTSIPRIIDFTNKTMDFPALQKEQSQNSTPNEGITANEANDHFNNVHHATKTWASAANTANTTRTVNSDTVSLGTTITYQEVQESIAEAVQEATEKLEEKFLGKLQNLRTELEQAQITTLQTEMQKLSEQNQDLKNMLQAALAAFAEPQQSITTPLRDPVASPNNTPPRNLDHKFEQVSRKNKRQCNNPTPEKLPPVTKPTASVSSPNQFEAFRKETDSDDEEDTMMTDLMDVAEPTSNATTQAIPSKTIALTAQAKPSIPAKKNPSTSTSQPRLLQSYLDSTKPVAATKVSKATKHTSSLTRASVQPPRTSRVTGRGN